MKKKTKLIDFQFQMHRAVYFLAVFSIFLSLFFVCASTYTKLFTLCTAPIFAAIKCMQQRKYFAFVNMYLCNQWIFVCFFCSFLLLLFAVFVFCDEQAWVCDNFVELMMVVLLARFFRFYSACALVYGLFTTKCIEPTFVEHETA